MRALLTFFLVLLLPSCGSASEDGQNGTAPTATAADASPPAAPGDPDLAAFRGEWLEACIGGARDAAPPGTPVELHCACAIDNVMEGRSLVELEADQLSGAYGPRFQAEMRACIARIPG